MDRQTAVICQLLFSVIAQALSLPFKVILRCEDVAHLKHAFYTSRDLRGSGRLSPARRMKPYLNTNHHANDHSKPVRLLVFLYHQNPT